MSQRNFYAVLGLKETATQAEIKSAYRKLAREFHPDSAESVVAGGKFAEISDAYTTLGSALKRKQYDRDNNLGAFRVFETYEQNATYSAREDTTSEEAVRRSWETLQAHKQEEDLYEGPTGLRMEGKLRRLQETSFSKLKQRFTEALSAIQKKGQSFQSSTTGFVDPREYTFTINALESIRGTVREIAIQENNKPRVLRIRVPSGTADHQVLRITPSENHVIRVRVRVVDHPLVQREGNDIVLRLPVTISEALHGMELSVPVVGGSVRVKLPPQKKKAKRLRLKGRGIQGPKSKGDLYVVPHIVSPDAVDDTAKQAARALDYYYKEPVRKDLPEEL